MEDPHSLLPWGPLSILCIVVEPQPTRQSDGQRRETYAAGKCNQVVEDGDGFGEDESDRCEEDDGAEPSTPVDKAIALEVWAISENAHEAVFRGDVKIQASRHDEPYEPYAIGNLFDGTTGALLSIVRSSLQSHSFIDLRE